MHLRPPGVPGTQVPWELVLGGAGEAWSGPPVPDKPAVLPPRVPDLPRMGRAAWAARPTGQRAGRLSAFGGGAGGRGSGKRGVQPVASSGSALWSQGRVSVLRTCACGACLPGRLVNTPVA